jgi:hypothetical protein
VSEICDAESARAENPYHLIAESACGRRPEPSASFQLSDGHAQSLSDGGSDSLAEYLASGAQASMSVLLDDEYGVAIAVWDSTVCALAKRKVECRCNVLVTGLSMAIARSDGER